MDRRSLVLTLLAFASLTMVVVVGSTVVRCAERSEAEPEREQPAPEPVVVPERPDEQALAFFGPLAEGARFDGWTIARVHPRRDGALPLSLERSAGETVEVELRSLDPDSPSPIASTPSLAIYVRGREISELARAGSEALARALAEREVAGHTLVGLQPLADKH